LKSIRTVANFRFMPKLQVSLPDAPAVSHELGEDLISIGRLADNTLQIDDASVSSHHAQLVFEGTDYILSDLGSTNGTRVNGNSLGEGEEHRLTGGDRIRFGNIETIYESDSADTRPLPVEDEPVAVAAESSVRPADFSNASPFQTKKKKKDPVGTAVFALAGLAILVFAGAVASIFMLQPPS
jgi:pSer/pThr/pTyr-binding forkhead associated (FHA) protein